MLRKLITTTWHASKLARKAIIEKMSAPSKITRPARDAPHLAADPIRKRKILLKANVKRETLANDILRSIGKHPTKPPLNHEMFPFVGHYINEDSDLATVDMSKTSETDTEKNATAAWDLTPLELSLSSSGLTLPASGLKFPSSGLIVPSSRLNLPPTEPSLIRFDPHFPNFDPGFLTMNQQPVTVDPRHLVLDPRPLLVDPRPITCVQPSPVVQSAPVQPSPVAQPPTQARRPVYIARTVQEPYPEMIMSVLNFLRDNGVNETADEFESEITLRGWTTLFERDGVVVQVDRSLEDRVREAMGRDGGQSTS